MRVAAHSEHRPSEHKPKEDSLAAKLLEQQEKALIAQNAKALSDQLFEIDQQQHQQRSGTGKGVASTLQHHVVSKHSQSPKLVQNRQISQPGGSQACNRM
jgi:hypothetical protein